MYKRYRSSLTRQLIAGHLAWFNDNDDLRKVHIIVNTTFDGCTQHLVDRSSDGWIILNISPEAIRGYTTDDNGIRFEARFNGEPHVVEVPYPFIRTIYSITLGGEMVGETQLNGITTDEFELAEVTPAPAVKEKPSLRVVK